MRAIVAIAIAGCSFDHGRLPEQIADDAPPVIDDARPIDARPIDAPFDARMCPAAPSSCTLFKCPSSTSCYYLCGTTGTTDQNWMGANSSCQTSQRGCLVTISDQDEQNCITTQAMPSFPNAVTWIGYRQASTATQVNQGWAWTCGSSTYVSPAWGMFEPNDNDVVPNEDHEEDCVGLVDFGGWNDAACSGNGRFVCELP